MKIAVVGAGVAGAFCSNALKKMGISVTVFEAGRGPGGRMARRKEGEFQFDHGAQFFLAEREAFQRFFFSRHTRFISEMNNRFYIFSQVQEMKSKEVVKEWIGTFGELNLATANPSFLADSSQKLRYVGTPSQSAICRHQLQGIDTRYSTAVRSTERHGGQWHLFGAAATGELPPPLGSFDALVLADRLCADRSSRLYCAVDSAARVPSAAAGPLHIQALAPPRARAFACIHPYTFLSLYGKRLERSEPSRPLALVRAHASCMGRAFRPSWRGSSRGPASS